jgi:hypothetical protein
MPGIVRLEKQQTTKETKMDVLRSLHSGKRQKIASKCAIF